MSERPYVPPGCFRLTGPQLNAVAVLMVFALGAGYYLRYYGIENAKVALACQAGADTWFCAVLRMLPPLFRHSVFGWSALAAALLNLIYPSLILFAFAILAVAFGLILYNAGLCGLAAAVLMLSLARHARGATGH